jgi:hypothetical protein
MYVLAISLIFSLQKPLICQIDWKSGYRRLPGRSIRPAIVDVSEYAAGCHLKCSATCFYCFVHGRQTTIGWAQAAMPYMEDKQWHLHRNAQASARRGTAASERVISRRRRDVRNLKLTTSRRVYSANSLQPHTNARVASAPW